MAPLRSVQTSTSNSATHTHTTSAVVRESLTSLLVVGSVCFGGTTVQALCNRQAPQLALASGLHSARRWGGSSAGFSGGRALGQLLRQRDDVLCAALGACLAGVCGATSINQIPMRVGAFVAVTGALDVMHNRLTTIDLESPKAERRRREIGPGLVEKSIANPYGIPVLPPDEAYLKVWREVSELYPWLRWAAKHLPTTPTG